MTGVAHITGGGLKENIERILPKTVSVLIEKSAIPQQTIFNDIQRLGSVSDDEMYRVFNMGIGMVIISERTLPENSDCVALGRVSEGRGEVTLV